MGDINIDLHDTKCTGYRELENVLDTYSLRNLVKDKTCFFNGHQSSIDVILTNKHTKFSLSRSFELGVTDFIK